MSAARDASPDTESPVFVLSASRSGSTLLRFILDSHPVLACPPETGIGGACTGLARSLQILESAASSTSALHESPTLTAGIARALRRTVDDAYQAYLRSRQKTRWCDKSLDGFASARLFAQLYPQAKFICLYRHCMDVIASGVEACPWGVSRYGFDAYVAHSPGNSVAAIGSYWLDCNRSIREFQKAHPDRCHQIRYEDLCAAPDQVAGEMFAFLGVEPIPGIADQCFDTPHDAGGPGDEKIWFTSGVTMSSVGRGLKVPVYALPVPLRAAVNELLDELDYRTVEDGWNEATGPFDPRARSAPPDGGARGAASGEARQVIEALRGRVRSRTPADVAGLLTQWPTLAGQTFVAAVAGEGGREDVRWTFGPHPDRHQGQEPGSPDRVAATLLASPGAWRSLLDGETNLITEISAGNVRCVNNRDSYRLRSAEVHAIAALLGLARIPLTRVPAEAAVPV